MTTRSSVFLDALGEEATRLTPELYEYVAGPPTRDDLPGPIGVGQGVLECAGSRLGLFMMLLRPLIGPGALVTRHEHNVPFQIVNSATVNEHGRTQLTATRTFQFRAGPQSFRDALAASDEPGVLLNHLGSRERVIVVLDCAVSERGHLLLTSRSAHIRVGRGRIKLPRLLGVAVHVEDGYDAELQRRTIDVGVTNPILGVVMRYHGWFHYRHDRGTYPSPSVR